MTNFLRNLVHLDKALLTLWFVLTLSGGFVLSSVVSGIDFVIGSLGILQRHFLQVLVSIFCFLLLIFLPSSKLFKTARFALPAALLIAIFVLVFGTTVNGSTRFFRVNFFGLGSFTVYAHVIILLAALLFFANPQAVKQPLKVISLEIPFANFLLFLALLIFILYQPDLHLFFILVAVAFVAAYLYGLRLAMIVSVIPISILAIIVFVVMEPYRFRRIIQYLDPWADPFGSGYQLTQSLMAIGNGGWTGLGFGQSLMKREYLPNAHTDFIISIIAEELGVIGVAAVLGLLMLLVLKIFQIGNRCFEHGSFFGACFSWLSALILTLDTVIHCTSAAGLTPMTGSLPWFSYGGNNLIFCTTLLAIVIKLDLERKLGTLPKDRSEWRLSSREGRK